MTDKPRLLFIANSILGWKTYSNQVEKVLKRREDIDSVVHWRRPSSLATAVVKRHDINHWYERFHRVVDPLDAYRYWLGRDIREVVRKTQPDIVHFASHWPAAALLDMPDAPPFTISLDATRLNIEEDFGASVWTQANLRAEQRLFQRAAGIFPMSEWTAGSLQREYEIPRSKISIVPPAQDMSKFAPKRDHDGKVNVIFIGNDFKRKGGHRLARWIRGPLADICHLHIVSADPDAAVPGPGITIHGKVPHDRLLTQILPMMDVMCLPTSLDMSPHVLVEAAAAGLPAVASRLGGIPDIVLHGQTGLLVDRADDQGFINALRQLAISPETRARMGRDARAHAVATFDASEVVNRMIDGLSLLMERPEHDSLGQPLRARDLGPLADQPRPA